MYVSISRFIGEKKIKNAFWHRGNSFADDNCFLLDLLSLPLLNNLHLIKEITVWGKYVGGKTLYILKKINWSYLFDFWNLAFLTLWLWNCS